MASSGVNIHSKRCNETLDEHLHVAHPAVSKCLLTDFKKWEELDLEKTNVNTLVNKINFKIHNGRETTSNVSQPLARDFEMGAGLDLACNSFLPLK